MSTIVKATETDFRIVADIARISFIESHQASAAPQEIDTYVQEKYEYEVIRKELSEPQNIYYLIYHERQLAGYSKIIFDFGHPDITEPNVTLLERIYLLKTFYDLKLGVQLFNFNLQLSKQNGQTGMWLHVWQENKRAIDFYKRNGFAIIKNSEFRLTETHINSCYDMFLSYQAMLG